MNGETEEMKEGWHLDKKVPLSIILALMVQTAALIIWGARLDGRVTSTEAYVLRHEMEISANKNAMNTVLVGLARIEERQIVTSENVKEIRSRLDEKGK